MDIQYIVKPLDKVYQIPTGHSPHSMLIPSLVPRLWYVVWHYAARLLEKMEAIDHVTFFTKNEIHN